MKIKYISILQEIFQSFKIVIITTNKKITLILLIGLLIVVPALM